MAYKMIRLVGLLSIAVGVVLLVVGLIRALGSGDTTDFRAATGMIWLAFFFIAILATRVGSLLEAQADEIADLRRRLTETK